MNEIWKLLPEHNGFEVSNLGRLRNVKKQKIRKLTLCDTGYLYANLRMHNCKPRSIKIHRLVALLFLPNNEEKPQINHINGIKTDNRVENLEWVTHSENALHSHRILKNRGGYGLNHGKVKLTLEDVKMIVDLYRQGMSATQIHKHINKVGKTSIRAILERRSWRHFTDGYSLTRTI